MYEIAWDKKALKKLSKLSHDIEKRIFNRTNIVLAENPYHGEKLTGIYKSLYKFRVGDHRVVYQVVEKMLVVRVIKIGHRREVYDN